MDNDNANWQRLALFAGWDKWSLGVEDYEIEAIKEHIKKTNNAVKSKKTKSGLPTFD